jgi:hypothetical protein
MKDRSGEVWDMNYIAGNPTILVLESNSRGVNESYLHRCLIISIADTNASRWSVGQIKTIAGWDDLMTEIGWTRLV